MSIIGYVTIGAHDTAAALPFYDAVMGALGADRKFLDGGWAGYGETGQGESSVYVCPPFEGQAKAGNGIMVALKAPNPAAVGAAHAAALAQGGKDEGAPGPRPADSTTFYGAYFRDPTGNKICVFCKP